MIQICCQGVAAQLGVTYPPLCMQMQQCDYLTNGM